MRSYFLIIAMVFVFSCKKEPSLPFDNGFYKHPVFDLSTVSTMIIEISTVQWNKLLLDFDRNPRNEEKYPADFTFIKNGDTTKLNNIAIRLRGNTSRRRPEGNTGELHNSQNPTWRNAHFLLDFRKYEKEHRLFGLEKLILKWHKDDATYCREIFSYNLFAKFDVWIAPRVAYTKIYIKIKEDSKPAYFGIYAAIEHINEMFVADRHAASYFSTSTGNLWKCTYTSGNTGGPANLMLSGALNKMGIEDVKLDESRSLRYSYDLKTNDKNLASAKTEFHSWITNLNTLTGTAFQTWISENLDVDLFLKTYAVNVAVGMWDDYWGNANNYFLYFESNTKKCYFIPYDYDNVLGTTWEAFDGAKEDVLRWGGSNSAPLTTKILAIPEYRQKYLHYLNELIDPTKDLFHVDKSIARIQGWHQLFKNDVKSDCIETSETSHSIVDRAASWGDKGYKIFQRGSMNFFELKETAIKKHN